MNRFTIAAAIFLATPAASQDHGQMDHSANMVHQQGGMQQMGSLATLPPELTQAGQSAFAAIQEAVSLLERDPETDWSSVNIDALRDHLVDMNNVTLYASVVAKNVDGGATFTVTSENPAVASSIRRMLMAHAGMVTSEAGWSTESGHVANGATLTIVGDSHSSEKIRALGFFGILALGMHHQAHHLALAKGANAHAH